MFYINQLCGRTTQTAAILNLLTRLQSLKSDNMLLTVAKFFCENGSSPF
jgi:hypothetical protein